ncbi:MAG: cobyrinate a,c-diamide synthase [Selenomonadaceae bacterium]|nr:cobyrinate a,c-diamide synthase [Selenomonadaceae bacterium]
MLNNLPRLIISATQSGSGKTTITTGLLIALKNRGLNVQPCKVGPDYIDTGWHALACGKPSHNLDSLLVGANNLQKIFTDAARDADISVIEGVMGLFDGTRNGHGSTAEIAKLLDAPVILVVDAKSMGASAAAIALGFREFDKSVKLAGVILNRLGSDSHAKLIVDALDKLGIKVFGAIRRNDEFKLPERHLGLVPTTENFSADVLKKICAAVENQVDVDALIDIARNSKPLETFTRDEKIFHVVKIAVARDAAFNFYYDASLNVLEQFGAQIIFFSPLEDESLPAEVDGLIIGGGFPEMFAAQLERNKKIRNEIFRAAKDGLPIFAECGGFMYLMNRLVDFDGKSFEMCGVLDGSATMTRKLQRVGYVEAELFADCVLGSSGEKFFAHEFHYSTADVAENIFACKRLRTGENFTAGVSVKNVAASYLHLHFAGCPRLAKNFVEACVKRRR